jgi:hypothetical protein
MDTGDFHGVTDFISSSRVRQSTEDSCCGILGVDTSLDDMNISQEHFPPSSGYCLQRNYTAESFTVQAPTGYSFFLHLQTDPEHGTTVLLRNVCANLPEHHYENKAVSVLN